MLILKIRTPDHRIHRATPFGSRTHFHVTDCGLGIQHFQERQYQALHTAVAATTPLTCLACLALES